MTLHIVYRDEGEGTRKFKELNLGLLAKPQLATVVDTTLKN
jgi:hypothetical protein